jgi:putative PIN family toxin of toxin-antitoxin system
LSAAGPPQGAKAPSGGSAVHEVASVGARVVLDTNIVLDLLVFADAAARPLGAALAEGSLQWIATRAMRDELERVLGYPQIASRLAYYTLQSSEILGRFDAQVRLAEVPAKASVTCSDPDDQKFIDLAVAHQCLLLSKDAAVLSMARRLSALHVLAAAALPAQVAS